MALSACLPFLDTPVPPTGAQKVFPTSSHLVFFWVRLDIPRKGPGRGLPFRSHIEAIESSHTHEPSCPLGTACSNPRPDTLKQVLLKLQLTEST